jgi:hypothetical protein
MAEIDKFRRQLQAVIDLIIPSDDDPGALDLGTDTFVLHMLDSDAAILRPKVETGLAALDQASQSRFDGGFDTLSPAQRLTLLQDCETQPWFVGLSELVAEGFYADPANGGNREALSWTMIGYQHRLPDGPSGRVAAKYSVWKMGGKSDAPKD